MKTRISGDGYTHTHIHTREVKLSKKKKVPSLFQHDNAKHTRPSSLRWNCIVGKPALRHCE